MKGLPDSVFKLVDHSLAKPTRVYKLPSSEAENLWIKREDELSSGVSGSKLRKYASVIPFLKKHKIESVAMIGGPNSNNLIGLAQLLRENSISPIAFIREAADLQLRGNALLLDMLLAREEMNFIPRDNWDAVATIAKQFLDSAAMKGKRSHLLHEGCFGFEALPGAMTLAADLLRNERETGESFKRIYIDCGTGLSAIGLILGLEVALESGAIEREIVVTLIAEDQSGFLEKLESMRFALNKVIQLSKHEKTKIRFLHTRLSPKFGSINKSLFDECRLIAKSTGILMDPTYSVKHYNAAKHDCREFPLDGSSLFVFNGSALGLLGFQDKLST